ncbi:MAG: baseplate J/gp47 family protein [Nitrososphaerales archaeon]
MFTVDQIVQNIINQLKLLDPLVSAEIGTPERKIIEATAEMIASSQVDFTVLNQQHDLSALSGGRLDAYMSIFNFGRKQAVPAHGFVRFSRNIKGTNAIIIPLGTQVIANTNDIVFPTLTYVTTQAAVLEAGQLYVDVPIICATAGSVGNIDANQISGFGGFKSIPGITSVTNPRPIIGGSDMEDDAEYRIRFQNTFLRNISGTTDMFLALALSQPNISKANVVGPISRYQEQVQVPAVRDNALRTASSSYDPNGDLYPHKRTTVLSSIPYSKYTYKDNHYLTDSTLDPATAIFFRPEVDYIFNSPNATHDVTGTNEVQQVTVNATGGTFKLGFLGAMSNDIAYNATAAQVQSALVAIPTIGSGNVSVTGSAGGPWDVTFIGELRFRNVPMMTGDSSGLTGGSSTVTITELTAGVASLRGTGSSHIPNITILNPYIEGVNEAGNKKLQKDTVLLFEHAYISINSRNDIDYGIMNAVDVFIDGPNVANASSMEAVPNATHNLQNTNTGHWTYQKLTTPKVINFRRKIDGAPCAIGNRIQPLYWQPVVDVPNQLEIGDSIFYKANYYNPANNTYYNVLDGDTYKLPAHYAVAIEVNSYHGTIRARNGIEWFLSGPNYLRGALPTDTGDIYTGKFITELVGTEFAVNNYLYDQNVANLQAICESNKQVTQDVLVHAAKYRYFKPIVTIMYSLGATKSVVDASIIAALDAYYRNQYFGATIQISDILQVIHNVSGVDNVRWTNDSPSGNKIEEVGYDGNTLDGGPFYFTTDFYLQDNEIPAAPARNQIAITVRAQNTWNM